MIALPECLKYTGLLGHRYAVVSLHQGEWHCAVQVDSFQDAYKWAKRYDAPVKIFKKSGADWELVAMCNMKSPDPPLT